MEKPDILIVEDDETIRTQMKWALVHDYNVFIASDAEKAMEIIDASRPSLVILDLGLPPDAEGTSVGFDLLFRIVKTDPTIKVVVVSGNAERNSALEAVNQGAHDYFSKPVDIDELKAILKRAYYVNTLETEYRALQSQVESDSFGELIGASPEIQEVFSVVRKVATTDVPVLITGESGTGKELVARAIHNHSSRRDHPFIPINCGAIPEALMESELFGHEKGAFTGAHAQRRGKVELADKGTLFFDEIGELPLQLQVKLLRYLQDQKVERIGGRTSIDTDVRIVAATNSDIKAQVANEQFREDLYYRLAVVHLELPSLKERGDDILLLAKIFLNRLSDKESPPKILGSQAESALVRHDWPGNVRELENRIRRAVTFASGTTVTPDDLGFETAGIGKKTLNLKAAKEELEVELIGIVLDKHKGNISKAAEELGLTRPTLYSLIKKHDMKQ
ncbi:MAG: PEP-CTERM-box response regulator transcription factor [Proteobacteria bacterium]|nr:PEP-CTERM-box response regulator transcription factor [Pseudomonadota bacterium]